MSKLTRIEEKIDEVIKLYKLDYNIDPEAIILGPQDYFELCYVVKQNTKSSIFVEALIWKGLPVQISNLDGIQIKISSDQALKIMSHRQVLSRGEYQRNLANLSLSVQEPQKNVP